MKTVIVKKWFHKYCVLVFAQSNQMGQEFKRFLWIDTHSLEQQKKGALAPPFI